MCGIASNRRKKTVSRERRRSSVTTRRIGWLSISRIGFETDAKSPCPLRRRAAPRRLRQRRLAPLPSGLRGEGGRNLLEVRKADRRARPAEGSDRAVEVRIAGRRDCAPGDRRRQEAPAAEGRAGGGGQVERRERAGRGRDRQARPGGEGERPERRAESASTGRRCQRAGEGARPAARHGRLRAELATLELGRPLLPEGGHALGEVLARRRGRLQLCLELELLV